MVRKIYKIVFWAWLKRDSVKSQDLTSYNLPASRREQHRHR